MASPKSASSGLGLTSVLLVIFIVLKALKFIDWSWWWVFSPVWIPLALLIATGVLYTIVAIIASLIGKRAIKKMRERL